MDRAPTYRPPERMLFDSNAHLLPPTAQPPTQIPYSDPFRSAKDPFSSGSERSRRGSLGVPARACSSIQGKSKFVGRSLERGEAQKSGAGRARWHMRGRTAAPADGSWGDHSRILGLHGFMRHATFASSCIRLLVGQSGTWIGLCSEAASARSAGHRESQAAHRRTLDGRSRRPSEEQRDARNGAQALHMCPDAERKRRFSRPGTRRNADGSARQHPRITPLVPPRRLLLSDGELCSVMSCHVMLLQANASLTLSFQAKSLPTSPYRLLHRRLLSTLPPTRTMG